MAKLTPEEEKLLEELTAKREAPDEPRGGGHDLSIIVDLSDDNAVKRALKLGVLTRGDLDEFNDPPVPAGDGEEDEDGKPKAKADKSPKRRLSIADRAMGAEAE